MKILVLQHGEHDHPGAFRRLLAADRHDWVPVRLDLGESPPTLDGFDGLWVMGGVMDVWEEQAHPWLAAEKALIREAVEGRGLPYLGVCLGHQLLACALGGTVDRAARPEVGVLRVRLTGDGSASPFLDRVPQEIPCLQWHGAEVTRLPAGAKLLAASPDCAVQAMSWGPRALSVQFHLEAEAATVPNWTADRIWRDELDIHIGPGGAERLSAASAAHMDQFNAVARQVFINWQQAAARI